MIGRYWSTGISLRRREGVDSREQWAASVDFFDEGSGDTDVGPTPTEGTLKTRYFLSGSSGEAAAIRAAQEVRADAERIGVEFRPIGPDDDDPMVYLHRDNWVSEDNEVGAPEIERVLHAVAAALGWPSARSGFTPAVVQRDV
ncbi:hypothetical protein [Tsukamurella hominis]|uniref:hypothetical protein n=1 Tax=Tsukamurella hominis TaxID=1970232 RepID=UPI0039EA4517